MTTDISDETSPEGSSTHKSESSFNESNSISEYSDESQSIVHEMETIKAKKIK